jgi:arylsulfatase A-like enzyme
MMANLRRSAMPDWNRRGACVAALCLAFAVVLPAAAEGQPNIVIILADDLGYADLGMQGLTGIPTPAIDSIAVNGVRFTDGYSNHPVCSPSRAALMSGRYPHRFGFEHNSGPERFASPEFGVPRSVPTLAEKFKAAGYATAMVGKWHVGFREGLRPWERGFDHFYGFLAGAHSYWPDARAAALMRNGKPVPVPEYLTDAFGEEAAAFVDRSRETPFFLYLAFNAVHAPMHALPRDQAPFAAIADENRRIYAGMLTSMDRAVGRVLDAIRRNGLDRETLVMFFSDNGGPTQQTTSRNDPLRGVKGQMFEGGIRVPYAAQWPGRIPAGGTFREMVASFDYHATALAAAGLPTDGIDGVDLLPFLTGARHGPVHEALFWRAGANHAARLGNWKLVHVQGRDALYDLSADIGESRDLSASHPAELAKVRAAWDGWAKGTLPARWIRQDAGNADPGGRLKATPARGGTGRRD